MAAKVALWATVAIAALTLFLVGAMAGQGDDSGYGIAFVLMFLVVLGSLFVALAGAVGFVRSARLHSRKGLLMSAVPLAVVLLLIVIRISVSLF